MTNEIVQSDIELAQKLLRANRPENEIVAALIRRGIETGKAVQLIEDLGGGRAVTAEIRFMPAMAPMHCSGMPEMARTERPSQSAEQLFQRFQGASGFHPGPGRRQHSILLWSLAMIVAGGGMVVSGLAFADHRYHLKTRALLAQLESMAPVSGHAVPAAWSKTPPPDSGDVRQCRVLLDQIAQRQLDAGEQPRLQAILSRLDSLTRGRAAAVQSSRQPLARPAIELEIRQDGLHLCGSQVTPENALAIASSILGAPTRTNRLERAAKVIYAYDRYGLLIYSRAGGGHDCIVLDFDALGGTNGTESPFAGTLRIESNTIGADTDSQTLAAMKPLGLSRSGAEGGIFSGRCNHLGLYFAYLKSLERLSVVEIDLK